MDHLNNYDYPSLASLFNALTHTHTHTQRHLEIIIASGISQWSMA